MNCQKEVKSFPVASFKLIDMQLEQLFALFKSVEMHFSFEKAWLTQHN